MNSLFSRPAHSIELLEGRIAPALVTLNIFDQSGTAVSVSSTKGSVEQLEAAVGVLSGATATAALTLHLGAVFSAADITVTAGADLTDAIFTRVSFLDAGTIDLGKVTIDGELDRLNAGDSISSTPALTIVTVGSWGNGEAFDSVVVGGINSLTVKGDFNGAFLKVRGSDSEGPQPHLTDQHGKIGTLFIGGSVLGTARTDGGHILATGDIRTVTVIGSVKGFAAPTAPQTPPTTQDFNGRIFSGGAITTLLIGSDAQEGNLVGGDGAGSGQVVGGAGIANLTVKGSILGGLGLESGAIGAAGNLGLVVVTKNLVGGVGDRSGTLLSASAINNVKIGGLIRGGDGFNSGAIGCLGNLGPVVVTGDVIGGDGISSGQIVSQGMIKSITVQNLVGGSEFESGSIGSLKGLGPVLVKGSIFAGSGYRSGLITTEEAPTEGPTRTVNVPIASVTVLGSISGLPQPAGGSLAVGPKSGPGAGGILSSGRLGPVVVGGDLIGGDNFDTGRIWSSGSIASVKIGGTVRGGGGPGSGTIQSGRDLGPIAIGTSANGGDLIGDDGPGSGAVRSGGKLAKIDVFGSVLGGDGARSGSIETHGRGTAGNMGAVFIKGSLIGSFGSFSATDSGRILSSGNIASVTIGDSAEIVRGLAFGGGGDSGGNVLGGIALRSGTITSGLDLGAVKIKRNLQGGTGDESGKITSGGKLTSLTLGSDEISGQIIGGEGNYDTTVESGDQLGQVFAKGAIGPVVVFGSVSGNSTNSDGGAYSGQVRGLSIASIVVHGGLMGGLGKNSGGFTATSSNIGAVVIDTDLQGGGGSRSGFVSAEGNISSVKIGSALRGGNGSGSGFVAAGSNLGPVEAVFASASPDKSRPRISAGKMISSVTISDSILNTDILAGYTTSGSGFNPDAQIGTVTIGVGSGAGSMEGTNIVAGMSAGSGGFFGTIDDEVIATEFRTPAHSRIASVIVNHINNTANPYDAFGIVSETVVSVRVGGSPLLLTGGALNDDYRLVAPASDTAYGEIPIPSA